MYNKMKHIFVKWGQLSSSPSHVVGFSTWNSNSESTMRRCGWLGGGGAGGGRRGLKTWLTPKADICLVFLYAVRLLCRQYAAVYTVSSAGQVTDIGLVHLCGMLRGPGSTCPSPPGCRSALSYLNTNRLSKPSTKDNVSVLMRNSGLHAFLFKTIFTSFIQNGICSTSSYVFLPEQ